VKFADSGTKKKLQQRQWLESTTPIVRLLLADSVFRLITDMVYQYALYGLS